VDVAQELILPNTQDDRAKLRNPFGVFGLGLITLGIYLIFWWYYVNREMRDYGKATGYDLGENPTNSALALFPGGLIVVPALISLWRGTKRVQATQRVAEEEPLNGWIALVIYLVIGFVFAPYLQSELNKVWRKVGTALPGESLPDTPDTMPARLDSAPSQDAVAAPPAAEQAAPPATPPAGDQPPPPPAS